MTMHRNLAAGVALVAAAVMLTAGCSSKVAGLPILADPASPKAAATTPSTTVSGGGGAGPVGELVDVSGKGVIRRSADGARWAPSPEPGGLVSTPEAGCTLGAAVKRNGRSGFLIANHCVKSGAPQRVRINAEAQNPLLIGTAVEGDPMTDSAVIWTEEAAGDSMIAGTWPVRGVLTVRQIDALADDTPICMNTATSGVTCGGKSMGSRTVTTTAQVVPGDSGSAAFVVDSVGAAWLVGTVTDNPGGRSMIRAAAPTLERLGATAITA
jgi:hypothetical protein